MRQSHVSVSVGSSLVYDDLWKVREQIFQELSEILILGQPSYVKFCDSKLALTEIKIPPDYLACFVNASVHTETIMQDELYLE